MKRWLLPLSAVCLAMVLMVPRSVQAAIPRASGTSLGTFGSWHAYTYDEGGQMVCYMVTTKIVQSSGLKKRATPYLMITHRPIEASTDVFSYGAGTMLNARRGIKLQIGKTSFDLFSVSDIAWARDGLTDHKIAAAIQKERLAMASGYPFKKATKRINDVFDLKGAGMAYHAIGKACGVLRGSERLTRSSTRRTNSRK